MNSGKSTALLQVAHNYEERGMHVLLIKPKIDTKGADQIVSRMGTARHVDILTDTNFKIAPAVRQWDKDVEKISCVLIDEAQFLSPDQVDELLELTVKDNIPVIAYGLRTDFKTESFPGSRRLFEVAHTLEELKTICRCGRKAVFNGRKIGNKFVFEGEQVFIDGKNQAGYESLCASCYMQQKSNSSLSLK